MGAIAAALAGREFQVEERETIDRSFSLSEAAGTNEVKVDNIDGTLDVVGYPGSEVRLTVQKTIRAESSEKLAEARRDVRLDLAQRGNSIEAYVEAPWRCKDGGVNYRGERWYGYTVRHDFTVRLPENARLYARTLNHGNIKVENLSGPFDLKSINGGIEMQQISGSGDAYALNGGVRIVFRRNPRANSYFGSLNGEISVAFQPGLSADVRIKTFNGKVYTDFPVIPLPPSSGAGERRNGKFIYKSDRYYGLRVGSGGPELKFDGFNGDIVISSKP